MPKSVVGHPDLCLSGPYIPVKNTPEEVEAATAYIQRHAGDAAQEILEILGITDE